MPRLAWRYSNDAGVIIENVYKFCMEEKKSGIKLSLNCVWDRTAALTGLSASTAQKIVEEKKKAQDEQQQPRQPPSGYVESVARWLTRVLYGGPSPACTPRRRFCQPLITSEQSSNRVLVTLAIRVVFAKISFIRSLLTLWGELKSADEETRCSPQQRQIPSQGQVVERGGLHSRLYRWNLRSYQPRCLEMLAR